VSDSRTTGQQRDARPADRASNGSRSNGSRSNGKRPLPPAQLARRAAEELSELLGHEAESIVGLERTDDGWCIDLEVLDTPRIPSTSDILAQYSVNVDRHGHLLGYRRVRRYARGRLQDDA
jgi:hypothetical protein